VKKKPTEQPEPATPPRLHTTEQLAETIAYHVVTDHVVTVRDAIRAGRIHAVRFGKSWRIPHSEFERIIAEGLPR
jgi:excisionase family DNA binding protein